MAPTTRKADADNQNDKMLALMERLEKKIDQNHHDIGIKIDKQSAIIRDEFTKRLVEIQSEIQNNVQRDLSHHASRTDDLSAVVESNERNTKLNDVILRGIPVSEKENLLSIFDQISSTIGYEAKHSTVNNIIRFRSKDNKSDAAILVKFLSTISKREFMTKYFAHRSLNLKAIGMESENRIYASDNLTKSNLDIQQKAVKLLKEKKVLKVHTRAGQVFVKFKEGEEFVQIRNSADLQITRIEQPF